jgi:hypothetical protein
MLIPGLQEFAAMLLYQALHAVQVTAIEAVIDYQLDRVQPELGFISPCLDMNVGWLSPFVTEEEKTKSSDTEDGRHPHLVVGSSQPTCWHCSLRNPRGTSP